MNRAKWACTIGVFLIGVFLLGLMGVLHHRPQAHRMPLLDDSRAMRQEILKRVPIGSDARRAQSVMRANGFECWMMRSQAFAEDDPVRRGQKVHAPADFLYCDRSAPAGLFVWRRWQVAIVDRGGAVSEVHVSVGLIGP